MERKELGGCDFQLEKYQRFISNENIVFVLRYIHIIGNITRLNMTIWGPMKARTLRAFISNFFLKKIRFYFKVALVGILNAVLTLPGTSEEKQIPRRSGCHK